MGITGVVAGNEKALAQNTQADRKAEDARAQNDRRQVQAAKEEEVRRPQEPNRGQNTDITV